MKRGPGNGMPAPATGDTAVGPGKALPFGPEPGDVRVSPRLPPPGCREGPASRPSPGVHLAGAPDRGGSAASGPSTSSGTASRSERSGDARRRAASQEAEPVSLPVPRSSGLRIQCGHAAVAGRLLPRFSAMRGARDFSRSVFPVPSGITVAA